MKKIIFLVLALNITECFSAISRPSIVVAMFGKGNSMATDIGVIKALHQYFVSKEGQQVVENE